MNAIPLLKKVLFVLTLLILASMSGSVSTVTGSEWALSPDAIRVVNPSFEDVQIGPPFFSGNPADLPGWTHAGAGDGALFAVGYTDPSGSVVIAGDKNQFLTVGGGFGGVGFASCMQTITGFVPGGRYELSFMMATEGETDSQTIDVSFPAGSQTRGRTFTSGQSSAMYWRNWERKSMNFVPNAPSVTLEFSVTAQYDVGIDLVRIKQIQ